MRLDLGTCWGGLCKAHLKSYTRTKVTHPHKTENKKKNTNQAWNILGHSRNTQTKMHTPPLTPVHHRLTSLGPRSPHDASRGDKRGHMMIQPWHQIRKVKNRIALQEYPLQTYIILAAEIPLKPTNNSKTKSN